MNEKLLAVDEALALLLEAAVPVAETEDVQTTAAGGRLPSAAG